MWLLHFEFKENFSVWWQECMVEDWEGHKFMRKLNFIKSKLKYWNKVAFGDLREENFHSFGLRIANGRRSRKFIKSLISEKGVTLSNIEVISEEIVNFFGKLYSKPEGASWRVEGLDWIPISGESAVWLDRPFSEEGCWDVIKEDLMRVFLEFHTNGIIKQSTNATFIALVLSKHLRKVLHETIFGSQGAFVEGRHILDAVLIANEVVDEKRRSGEEGVVFKIDFEKGWVKASKGLRQEDPLSPFLFTLVANVLSRLMIKAEETRLTEGFFVGRDRTRVSLLQFADDTIFFSKASLEHLQNLKIILLVFGQVSRLKINLEKSTISGLPLRGNQKTIGFWDPLVERISRRLDGWKKTFLSLEGGLL
ncbi:hypothetical protein CK203_035098 [Vitis vinifera]|uniref:Reverse transcriptase domain-containing protein n=1 Tax=Vitis vinifera TaxID=29760 RepID=A0A438I9S6_VITVI|nr:hypothetical protein CK203_035098 [Vitis vinifera]